MENKNTNTNTNKKIKVLFDFDLIGFGFINRKSSTGIYRVAIEVLKELKKCNDIEMYFCTSLLLRDDFIGISEELDFFDYREIISFLTFKESIIKKIKKIRSRLIRENDRKKLNIKIKRFLLSIFLKIIKLSIPNIKCFNDKKLRQFDIYSSFYYKIPEFIAKSGIKTSIIVHDVIAFGCNDKMYNSEKKIADFVKTLNDIVNSIKDDTIVFCDSSFTKSELLKFVPRLENNEVIVNYLAVNKNRFRYLENRDQKNSIDRKNIEEVLRKYGIPTDKPYFLSLCLINPRKNLEFVVDSFVRFLDEKEKQDKDIREKLNLVLAGPEDEDENKLFKKIKNNPKYRNNIIITGYVDDDDLNYLYNGSLAFTYVSLYEGFGLPPLEAMQCGVPTITSNVTSIPEVVGNAALTINPKEESEMVSALNSTYDDENLRKELIEKSLKRAKEFDWHKTADKIVNTYMKYFENKI